MSDDSFSDIWKLKNRGKRDSDRHKELIERAIKKNGKELITEYNIIKSDGDKKIKIPIKFLDKYRVKYGKLNNEQGVGQGMGDAKPGDKYKIGSGKPLQGKGDKAGEQEGEKIFEAEITVNELVDILLKELNLPWMDPKNTTQVEIENEELTSISNRGPMSNLHLKKSLIENIKRNAMSGKAKVGNFKKSDLKYRDWEPEKEYHSNAVVYLLLDRSGSMDKERTHVAKSFYFWMVQFLKRKYKNVELVFIAHDVTAFTVSEEDFFKISGSGGTACSSAFKLAYEHLNENYSPTTHNIYIMEMSDGDNLENDNIICLEYINKLLPLVKAMGYGEVNLTPGSNIWANPDNILSTYLKNNINRTKFVSMNFKKKDDIYDGLKSFFNIDGRTKK